jgi:hypothetical protein
MMNPMQETPGVSISYWIGRMLPVVLVTVGAIWCFAMMRRPTVNRKGVASLGSILLSWAAGMIGPMTSVPALKVVSGGFSVIGVLAAIVLAIAALVEDSGAPGKYRQGKGQAIASLILAGVTGMAVMFFALTTVVMKQREARQARASAATGKPLELPDERFRLKTVPSPWVKLENPRKLNSLACLGLTRTRPEMYCMVIAEPVAADNDANLGLFVGAVKSNMLQADPTAQVLEEVPETLNGREGVRMVVSARVSNLDLVYRYWLHCSPGFVYQVISWCPGKDRAALMSQSEPLFSNIEILAPNE